MRFDYSLTVKNAIAELIYMSKKIEDITYNKQWDKNNFKFQDSEKERLKPKINFIYNKYFKDVEYYNFWDLLIEYCPDELRKDIQMSYYEFPRVRYFTTVLRLIDFKNGVIE